MGGHVYDPFCHCLLNIVLYEIKIETLESWGLLWSSLNE